MKIISAKEHAENIEFEEYVQRGFRAAQGRAARDRRRQGTAILFMIILVAAAVFGGSYFGSFGGLCAGMLIALGIIFLFDKFSPRTKDSYTPFGDE